MTNGKMLFFTTQDSSLCTPPDSSAAALPLAAATASKRFENTTGTKPATKSHLAPGWPASLPPRCDALNQSLQAERPIPCVWSASNLRRADNARPTRPTLYGSSAGDSPRAHGGTKADIFPGKCSSLRNDRGSGPGTGSPRSFLFFFRG